MFSCCRCNNTKKDHKSKKDKDKCSDTKDNILEDSTTPDACNNEDHAGDIIEIRLKDPKDYENNGIEERMDSVESDKIESNQNGFNGNTETSQDYNNDDDKIRLKSDSSNSTVEESIVVNKSKDTETNDTISGDNTTSTMPNHQLGSSNYTKDNNSKDSDTATITNGDLPKSCISRRSSSKSSIRKKVNINDSTEVIPSSELASIDDDEVFSDSIPPKIARGDMCAPYIRKRGSISGCFTLPEWFNNDDSEYGGSLEPPVTPVGRDELALKRHRMYSELLLAAQAAVEHRVRFDPLGPDFANEDCDPDLKPSATAELENLVNRLERLVDRLERSISARELDLANKTFDSVIETKRRSFDIEAAELPPLPDPPSQQIENIENSLGERIERLETSLNHINNNFKRNSSEEDDSLENIPTVLDEYLQEEEIVQSINSSNNMSVAGYQDIVAGPLAQYLALSAKIGGDVAQQADLVKLAFNAQLQYVTLATQISQPAQPKQMELLKPTSDQINAIQNFREKNRTSSFFNHLSAISESIPALGWVCVAPTPGPHVKEMNDAGQFYTNRVLKDWKEKNVTHVEWARSWVQTLTQLQQYIKQYHTTGLVWSGKGGAPPPPPPSAAGCPPPPPPPIAAFDDLSLGTDDERSALFAQINQGEGITRNLKKVTADMQTHKNTTLRTGPAPFKAPQQFGAPSAPPSVQQMDKPPVFSRDGKKWLIEYQKSNPSLIVDNAEMNNVVYMFRCQNSTLTVKGKINSIIMDSCKKCSVLFDSVVASVEFVNCQSMQMQVLGKVPTISIDKSDGCQMYLSKDSMDVEIISSKSSEMNVLIPKGDGDFIEQPIPEQYKTTIRGKSLVTICVESLG